MSASRPPRRREVTTAKAAVADALAWHGVDAELRAHRIVTEWRDIVGDRVAARTWPDGLTRGGPRDQGAQVLWVRVSSSAWLHELTLLKAQLVRSIHDYLGDPPLFDELRFHLGSRPADAGDLLAGVRSRLDRRRPHRTRPVPATGERRAAIEAEVATVADPELRAILREVRIRHDR